MSWHQLFVVAWSDLKRMLRRRDTLVWLLIMPLPYTYFFGIAFRASPAARTHVTVVSPSPDAGSRRIVDALEKAGYAVTVVPKWRWARPLPNHGFRVDLPAQPGHVLLGGRTATIAVWSRRGDLDAARLGAVIRQAVLALRIEGLARLARGEPVTVAALRQASPVVPIDVQVSDWGRRREVPSGFKQAVPGNMVMFVLMAVLITGAIRLVVDREAGHLQRMMATPVRAWVIVAAQFVSLGLLGLVEAAYFLVAGWLLFGQSVGPHPVAVLAVVALLVAAASGIGVILGTMLGSVKQAAAVGLVVTLALAALGGCWWPMELLPRWMKAVAMTLPSGQAMHALIRLMVWGETPSSVTGAAIYMVGLTAATTGLAVHALQRRVIAPGV